jgi:hypothetical protein
MPNPRKQKPTLPAWHALPDELAAQAEGLFEGEWGRYVLRLYHDVSDGLPFAYVELRHWPDAALPAFAQTLIIPAPIMDRLARDWLTRRASAPVEPVSRS